jgi:hypothetical protein
MDCNRLPRRPSSQPQPLKNPETLKKTKTETTTPMNTAQIKLLKTILAGSCYATLLASNS